MDRHEAKKVEEPRKSKCRMGRYINGKTGVKDIETMTG